MLLAEEQISEAQAVCPHSNRQMSRQSQCLLYFAGGGRSPVPARIPTLSQPLSLAGCMAECSGAVCCACRPRRLSSTAGRGCRELAVPTCCWQGRLRQTGCCAQAHQRPAAPASSASLLAQLPTRSSRAPCPSLLAVLDSCCSSAAGTMCSQVLLRCLLAPGRSTAPRLSLLRSTAPCCCSAAATTAGGPAVPLQLLLVQLPTHSGTAPRLCLLTWLAASCSRVAGTRRLPALPCLDLAAERGDLLWQPCCQTWCQQVAAQRQACPVYRGWQAPLALPLI